MNATDHKIVCECTVVEWLGWIDSAVYKRLTSVTGQSRTQIPNSGSNFGSIGWLCCRWTSPYMDAVNATVRHGDRVGADQPIAMGGALNDPGFAIDGRCDCLVDLPTVGIAP